MADNWTTDYAREVIKKLKLKNPSALASLVGVSSSTITRPLNNPNHPHGLSRITVEKIMAKTGIAPEDVLPNLSVFAGQLRELTQATSLDASNDAPKLQIVHNDEEAPDNSDLVAVRDISASAGYGALVGDYEAVAYKLAFPPDYLRSVTKADPENLQIISVKGDSMEPTLYDDDIVMLDISKTSLGYDGLFVLRFDDALHVKRVSRSRPGFVRIISDNKAIYPEQEYAIEDVQVVGKVLWKGGKV